MFQIDPALGFGRGDLISVWLQPLFEGLYDFGVLGEAVLSLVGVAFEVVELSRRGTGTDFSVNDFAVFSPPEF